MKEGLQSASFIELPITIIDIDVILKKNLTTLRILFLFFLTLSIRNSVCVSNDRNIFKKRWKEKKWKLEYEVRKRNIRMPNEKLKMQKNLS